MSDHALRVHFPERIVERHVGGNTTYARQLRDGLRRRGVETGLIPSGKHPATTALAETMYGLRRHPGAVLHYSADTGPLLPTRGASVVTVHGVASRWISVARSPLQEKLWRARVARAIRSTQRVITVSTSAADDVAAVFDIDPARITTIPHGMDVDHFSAPTDLSPELRAIVPAEYVLYLGNIEPRKNLVELVRAFSRPELARTGITLVIAGKPAWNFDEAMAAIASAPNVLHLGFVSDSDRIALMQAAQAFVFPSLYEGFGLPVLEALAAGTPVVASRRGSLREVAGPAREIVDLDEAGIASALVDALGDAAWRAVAPVDGPAWARRFAWDDSVERHLSVYRAVSAR
ncbi:glycosyltransferase family 4 protein [Agromyces atrinae]|uniref:Glycosyltransferase family 1 protein n=1 Tax=Agromyces atrinae TaxID=592376 RepID=A0A4Q2M2B8_9MICO|nr:glycosyltransferase family 1 protein [Agromyces atrinae]NYD68524.1 glycosyltransferase involved in cell wall biosynthesis [Agromyces atrinae]RXZ85909.1 glycosyltransferase family 1 protein [Agromyces atrinae]